VWVILVEIKNDDMGIPIVSRWLLPVVIRLSSERPELGAGLGIRDAAYDATHDGTQLDLGGIAHGR
jgi:hypothetical protein